MKDAKSAPHDSGYHAQGLTRSLHKDREYLEDGWQDTQTVSFANTSIKHATIAMADVGARSVHAGLRTLRVQALRIGTRTHDGGLATLRKDIPINNKGLLGDYLDKAVANAASASHVKRCLGTTSSCLASLGRSCPRVGSRR